MSPADATRAIEAQARALAARVRAREINESCVEGLLRQDARDFTDGREVEWIVFERGMMVFGEALQQPHPKGGGNG